MNRNHQSAGAQVESDPLAEERRFGGIARLYGQAALERFFRSRVCVIGIGGVGSWAAEALARSGIGALTLIDLDHVVESNVNRQLPALDGQFGKAKIDVMGERVRAIHPRCQIHLIDDFLTEDNLDRLIPPEYDFVIDCVDSFRVKAALIAHCRRQKSRVIMVGGAGGQIDPLQIRIADLSRSVHDPLLAKTRRLLRRQYHFPRNLKRRFDVPCVYSTEQPRFPTEDGGVCVGRTEAAAVSGLNCGGFGSAMPVTASFGLAAVAYLLARLAAA